MEMNNQERIAHLKAKDYQKYLGVKKKTFDVMIQILEKDYQRKHKKGGRPPKLSVLDKLMNMLKYYREYRVMDNIAFDHSASKSTISDAIKWIEETLVKGLCGYPLCSAERERAIDRERRSTKAPPKPRRLKRKEYSSKSLPPEKPHMKLQKL